MLHFGHAPSGCRKKKLPPVGTTLLISPCHVTVLFAESFKRPKAHKMGAFPVLDYIIDAPYDSPAAAEYFAQSDGAIVAEFRILLTAHIEYGATLLILPKDVD